MSILGEGLCCNFMAHVMLFATDPSNECYGFSDRQAQPDPYYSDYEPKFKGKDTAIVIDNGKKLFSISAIILFSRRPTCVQNASANRTFVDLHAYQQSI